MGRGCNQVAYNFQLCQNESVDRNSTIYLRLRRFVDHELSTNARPTSPFLGILPLALTGMVQGHLSALTAIWTWGIAAVIGGAGQSLLGGGAIGYSKPPSFEAIANMIGATNSLSHLNITRAKARSRQSRSARRCCGESGNRFR